VIRVHERHPDLSHRHGGLRQPWAIDEVHLRGMPTRGNLSIGCRTRQVRTDSANGQGRS
jgi:hypothetical protein